MGIFDRSPAEPEPLQENSQRHYLFAHYALRVAAFQHHLMMFPILNSPQRASFFDNLLETLDKYLEPAKEGERNFSGEDLRFAGFNIDGRPCAMIIMPPATRPTEAHFVVIVSRLTFDKMSPEAMEQEYELPPIDYYTLELPAFPRPDGKGVFCSWSHEDEHSNLGLGTRPDPEEFADFLRAKLRQK